MKITKNYLQQIIKEELEKALIEGDTNDYLIDPFDLPPAANDYNGILIKNFENEIRKLGEYTNDDVYDPRFEELAGDPWFNDIIKRANKREISWDPSDPDIGFETEPTPMTFEDLIRELKEQIPEYENMIMKVADEVKQNAEKTRM